MPVREKAQSPQVKEIPANKSFDSEGTVKSTPKPEPKQEEKGSVIFAESELREKSNDTLESIIACYGVDPKAEDGKNTQAKLIRIILREQKNAAASGNFPVGLAAFKESSIKSVLDATAENRGSISYNIGFTKNIGEFESLKISVGITLPFDYTQDELNKAKDACVVAKEICLSKVEEDIKDILPKLKK